MSLFIVRWPDHSVSNSGTDLSHESRAQMDECHSAWSLNMIMKNIIITIKQ